MLFLRQLLALPSLFYPFFSFRTFFSFSCTYASPLLRLLSSFLTSFAEAFPSLCVFPLFTSQHSPLSLVPSFSLILPLHLLSCVLPMPISIPCFLLSLPAFCLSLLSLRGLFYLHSCYIFVLATHLPTLPSPFFYIIHRSSSRPSIGTFFSHAASHVKH